MPIQAPGIGSNLDVNSIVSQLMALERKPIVLLQQQDARSLARLSAFGSLKGALAGFQTSARALDDPAKLRALGASVADGTLASASATGNAVEGSHALEVIQLAQQHKLRSEPFPGALDAVGTGTLTFQFGTYDSGSSTFTLNADKAAQTVTIASGQDTLAGIRDAVNAAAGDVSAAIINDGAGNRLVFTSRDSGLANSLRLTVIDGDGTNLNAAGLSRLAYDPAASAGTGKNLTETAAAQDAVFKLDGITVTKAANEVGDALPGVVLSLMKTGGPTTLSVAKDRKGIQSAVQTLVNAYNSLHATLKSLAGYDAGTKKGGPIQGDSAALTIESRIRSLVTGSVATGSALTTLSQVGVRIQRDGRLALDTAVLNTAIDTSFGDVAALFAALGRSSDARVAYQGSATTTQAGAYAVAVTQPATRGSLAGLDAAGLTITAGVNDLLQVAVDGVPAEATLAPGVYASATALAAEVQSRMNGALASGGGAVTVSVDAGKLTITSVRYGSTSVVSLTAGAARDNLLGATPAAAAGQNIAGAIDGAEAIGRGQDLTAAPGGAADGLRLRVQAGAPGAFGTVTFSRGIAAQLADLVDGYLGAGGAIQSRISGLNATSALNTKRAEVLEARMVDIEKRMRAQYAALDQMMSRMQSTSTYLQQQLNQLSRLNSR